MTLAVSLRVPDGLIIAADSLATTMGQVGVTVDAEAECPKCNEIVKIKDVKSPPIPIPATVSSFSQKVFPFKGIFGIATFGMAILNEKTIYYHARMLEKSMPKRESGVTEVAKKILEHFSAELRKQVKDIDKAPKGYSPLGFLVVGYDGDVGKTILLHIGKKSRIEEFVGSGCTYGGYGDVVAKVWELAKSHPQKSTTYGSFSLKDAVDYAEYLINTTANFQRFANMIPTVGGDVDIGLITPFRPFTWIKCKELTLQIEGGE